MLVPTSQYWLLFTGSAKYTPYIQLIAFLCLVRRAGFTPATGCDIGYPPQSPLLILSYRRIVWWKAWKSNPPRGSCKDLPPPWNMAPRCIYYHQVRYHTPSLTNQRLTIAQRPNFDLMVSLSSTSEVRFGKSNDSTKAFSEVLKMMCIVLGAFSVRAQECVSGIGHTALWHLVGPSSPCVRFGADAFAYLELAVPYGRSR